MVKFIYNLKLNFFMIEIVVIGRGGQGSVTTSKLIAIAAFYDGKESQAFPNFGVERMGAPSYAYVRISDKPIKIRSHVYAPDYIIVLDSSLVNEAIKLKKEKTKIIINSNKTTPNTITFDATKIALEVIGKPIVSTVVLGGFSKITKLVTLNSLLKAIDETFEGEIAEKNKKACKVAYNSIK